MKSSEISYEEDLKQEDLNMCEKHNERWVYFFFFLSKGLCNKCKKETHHSTTHHVHLVAELSKSILDDFYNKIDKGDNIRQQLKEKQDELHIPERSFTFGLEMINHVFDTVIRQIEEEK